MYIYLDSLCLEKPTSSTPLLLSKKKSHVVAFDSILTFFCLTMALHHCLKFKLRVKPSTPVFFLFVNASLLHGQILQTVSSTKFLGVRTQSNRGKAHVYNIDRCQSKQVALFPEKELDSAQQRLQQCSRMHPYTHTCTHTMYTPQYL